MIVIMANEIQVEFDVLYHNVEWKAMPLAQMTVTFVTKIFQPAALNDTKIYKGAIR